MIRTFVIPALLALAAASAARSADTYKIDSSHSGALFRIKHLNVSYNYGRFNDIGGTIGWSAADPARHSANIVIQAASIDTFNEKRDQHLKGPDFFNAKQFPTLTFVSREWKKVDDANYEVTGDLTIKGVTKPLTAKVAKIGEGKDPWGGQRLGLETTFTIKRSDFAMDFMLEGIGDDVVITFGVEGIKQ